jgi:hypothetical protein
LHTYRQDLITAWAQSVILVLSIFLLAPDLPVWQAFAKCAKTACCFQALNHVDASTKQFIGSTGSQLSAAMVVYQLCLG